ncbi:MAG: imidazole glycerol phosphate synthase subunit HisH [Spirochaetales bacterium]|nr:imidazole glycerol phosphate synthase subunit HisH [Spirochaetales bacterium]
MSTSLKTKTAARVGIVDYRAGNLRSVETAFRYIGSDFFISGQPEDFRSASHLVFPGVGDAGAAMRVLKETGLGQAIREFYTSGKPVLGICLGCQIVLSRSEEGNVECLDLIRGTVVRFPERPGFKVPHMGWNQVKDASGHPLFDGIPERSSFYFVHSYYPVPESTADCIGETEYGVTFASAICRDNCAAVQFHPEKSGERGLRLLGNFLKWKAG